MVHLKTKVKYMTSVKSQKITCSKVFEAPKSPTPSAALYKEEMLNPPMPDLFTEYKQRCSSKHWSDLPQISTLADSPPKKPSVHRIKRLPI